MAKERLTEAYTQRTSIQAWGVKAEDRMKGIFMRSSGRCSGLQLSPGNYVMDTNSFMSRK